MTTANTSPESRSSHRIRSVSVIGGFLDGVKLEFADGLNCIIGGRGTGKTTILEFVRFAFDAILGREVDYEERRRIEGLVEQNLGGGRVQVAIQTRNGLMYIVSRSWGEARVVLTADGHPTQLTLKSGGVFRADIYSQNEMERIAELTTSQLVLIDKFQGEAVADIEVRLRELERELTNNASQLLMLKERHVELQEEVATLPEVEDQLKAFKARRPEGSKLLHHSDRGCQYTTDAYQQTLRTLGIQCSMSRTGCCYDNAVMERFFWSLKHEWTKHEHFADLEDARLSVFKYIETFYNTVRLHQTLGYHSPNHYEAVHAPAHAA